MPLVFAAIAPHGGIAIAEACTPDERDVAIKTRARDLSASDHVSAGAAIAAVAAASDRRIALIASADHGHAHLGSGPYGFHPAAEEYDTLVTELVRTEQLDRLVDIPRAMVEDA